VSREIAKSGARLVFGVAALTALVALLQVVSCNRADAVGEGTWIMPCWVYEEEVVVAGTVSVRVSEERVIQVPYYRTAHHWHPLAVAGWTLPPAIALAAAVIAIRRRSSRVLKLGAIAALVVLATAALIAPRVAWQIGPPSRTPQTPAGEVAPFDEPLAHASTSDASSVCQTPHPTYTSTSPPLSNTSVPTGGCSDQRRDHR
jgi:hypothetical protein